MPKKQQEATAIIFSDCLIKELRALMEETDSFESIIWKLLELKRNRENGEI